MVWVKAGKLRDEWMNPISFSGWQWKHWILRWRLRWTIVEDWFERSPIGEAERNWCTAHWLERDCGQERIVWEDGLVRSGFVNLFWILLSININSFSGSHNHHVISTPEAIKGLDFSIFNWSTLAHFTVTAAIHSMLSAQGIRFMICRAGLLFWELRNHEDCLKHTQKYKCRTMTCSWKCFKPSRLSSDQFSFRRIHATHLNSTQWQSGNLHKSCFLFELMKRGIVWKVCVNLLWMFPWFNGNGEGHPVAIQFGRTRQRCS
jgi:hypothetical protein